MKKVMGLVLMFMLVLALFGCGKDAADTASGASKQTGEDEKASEAADNAADEKAGLPDSSEAAASVDLDLTNLSSTVVYSEVYNMMTAPEDYIGKKVRMKGQFTTFQGTDESGQPIPGQIYFACVIADATACCQQGLEFVLTGDHAYPEDYPELGTEITVVGEFQTYYEGEYLYCHLVDAEMSL